MSSIAYPSRKFVLHPESEATPFRSDAHRDPHHPGEWTDDTDHALLISLSCLHKDCKELNAQDFASRLSIWVRFGLLALDTLPLGLGRTVGSIVRTKTYLDDPEGTARLHWKNTNHHVAPNGSLMRTHPLGLLCLNKPLLDTFETAATYSVVTHVDPRCITSCAIGTALIRGILRQEVRREDDIDTTIAQGLSWWTGCRARQMQDPDRRDEPDLDLAEFRKHANVENLSMLQLDDGYKIGYVDKTFGSGIHLLRMAMRKSADSGYSLSAQSAMFESLITDLIMRGIMRGGDADTNACFAGALLGAYLGYRASPPHWRHGLRHGSWLTQKAEGLCQLLEVTEGIYKGSDDKETRSDGGHGFPTEKQMEEKAMLLQADMARRQLERTRMEEQQQKKGKGIGWLKWK
ncbi:hypothetical protein J3458_014498 [Metarhizium acridum]|uniref:ADP-ribosylglycohydrolase, putative n=1 Tax=Metarhizium acridum (strain CQMa 102) TaxID=655827 RepID=E9DXU2_METAQ|nr:ADP-ribosylglycohydrolase, putative [Metarhizium acridum CQMa 102]EFY91555.1 ADP-ribosylglycohydrolase, putative [Metarhizium acridum CQMa 102]KAG8412314.1 hypothetical protein J3458_014498 [Metarhizium acridum]